MKVTLDSDTIQAMNFFQNFTGSSVVDCITEGEEIYFVVGHGQYGLSVGRQGAKIKNAEKLFKKNIKVFEYSTDLKEFVKNLVPEAQETEINDKKIEIRIRQSDKAKVIGKGGKNIKILNKFLKRLFDIDSLKVK